MKEINFENTYKEEKIVLCFGFFDCVHRGHRFLINKAIEQAKTLNSKCAVFTFNNNPFVYYGSVEKEIFSYRERIQSLKELGVDIVLAAKMDKIFASQSPKEFLDNLFSKFDITMIFCGDDASFGYKGKGDINFLKMEAEKHGTKVEVVDYLKESGHKISSSSIRKLVANGNIELSNDLIGEPYKIIGQIVHNFGRGKTYGFPTANIFVDKNKLLPKFGVYITSVMVGGKTYQSITNVGEKPTFEVYTVSVESFIDNFDADIYGSEVTVRFYKYIRPILKFKNANELSAQLKTDLELSRKTERKI